MLDITDTHHLRQREPLGGVRAFLRWLVTPSARPGYQTRTMYPEFMIEDTRTARGARGAAHRGRSR